MEQQIIVKKQWRKRCLAAILGGTASAFAAPAIAGFATAGVVGIVVTSMVTGAMGSSLTTMVNNMIDADDILQVEYNPRHAEDAFRAAVQSFLQATFDPLFNSIRRNVADYVDVELKSDLRENLQALQVLVKDTSKLTMKIIIHIKPRANTTPRLLEDGAPPPTLPSFQRDVRQAYHLPRRSPTLLTGVPRSLITGLAAGAVFAPAIMVVPCLQQFHFFKTVPSSNLGVSLGAPTATAMVAPTLQIGILPTNLETLTAHIEFATELQNQFNRLKECGQLNGVEVDYDVHVRIETALDGKLELSEKNSMKADENSIFDWTLKST